MREWAFATSPHGLGLPDGGWNYTPREFRALVDIHRQYTIYRADFFNAHFRGTDVALWLGEDFLSEDSRAKRTREQQREKLMVQKANAALVTKIKRGAPPTEDVPSWAQGPYRGNVNG